ncbi:MAG: hypothetical protein QW478_09445, partial [Candidatus Micrarchaeaceae archaeon]
FIDDYKLGMLKIERKSFTLTIRGAKDYTLAEKEVRKGVKGKSIKISDNVYEYEQFERIKTRLHKGITDGITVKNQVKVISGIYDKGIVTESGRVKPITISTD